MSDEIADQLKRHFPFPELREAQVRALDKIAKTVSLNKEFTILELPTGTGKSGIALAAAGWAETPKHDYTKGFRLGSYILTTTHMLQSQYMRDFADKGLVELKGSSNYSCGRFDMDCSSGSKLSKASGEPCQMCPYKVAKNEFLDSTIGVTNFAYFLNEIRYAHQLPPRNLLIVDEAHNVEGQILGFADIEITRKKAEEVGITLPVFELGQSKRCHEWVKTQFIPAASVLEKTLEKEMTTAYLQGDLDLSLSIARKHDVVDKFVCRVNRFTTTDDPSQWLIYTDETNGSLFIKPLTATMFADELLFKQGNHKLFMSATILNPKIYIKNLGIDIDKVGYLSLPSEFPVANRPVFFKPAGSMSYNNWEKTLPKMLRYIDQILSKYSDLKGIIHTNSYKVTQAVVEYLKSTKHAYRIQSHTNEKGARDKAIARHVNDPGPTILVSPSMTEGLDLKDDLSRLQILCKVPFPSLQDKWILAKMEIDKDWYQMRTALTLIQATGRSIRNKDDYAISYILDSDFARFLSQSSHLLPKWWKEGIM